MQHFPIFLDTRDRKIIVAGGGETALAKLRLILKTEAQVVVFAPSPCPEIAALAGTGALEIVARDIESDDCAGAALVYAATDNADQDARIAAIARASGAIVNIVDNLQGSDFITPAIVDRDPVTVAIGTEGAAPVLARKIKAHLEEALPASTGVLARVGKSFRKMAEALPHGRARRAFWAEYYDDAGPRAYTAGGEAEVKRALGTLLRQHQHGETARGHVSFVGAGPGDPELLTLKARNVLHDADVVIHDRLVSAGILELARREAVVINVGKQGFGPSTAQAEINALIVEHALAGHKVVRLKGGDPTLFARLDEETAALDECEIPYSVVAGITAASAAAARIRTSLTRRGRNSGVRYVTGHDVSGFSDHDWAELAKPGAVTCLYMGRRAARFVQGRLLMHGASPLTPITMVENASLPTECVQHTTLQNLTDDLSLERSKAPVVMLLGVSPERVAEQATNIIRQEAN